MKDAIRQAVMDRGKKRWQRVHSPSFIGRLLRPLFGEKLEAVWIVERDASDLGSLACQGNVIAAWRLDAAGLNEIDSSEADPGPLHGRKWRTHVLRFHISDDDEVVVANEMEGPEQGTLIQFKVKPVDGGVKLVVRRTSLVLAGSAIG